MIPIVKTYRSTPYNYINEFLNNDSMETTIKKPLVNLSENKKAFEIEVSVPGFDKKDVQIKVEKNILTISSNQKETEKKEENTFVKKEFQTSAFRRSFKLPENIEYENISASQSNGILTITIPKKAPVEIKVQDISVN